MTRHDDGTELVFAAYPPAHGRGFARTWWGQAWLKALEEAALDGTQVKTGRRLARAGAVGTVSVRPGRVTAVVKDRDGTGYRADVLLAELPDEQWDRFLAMAVERAGHVAALLDHEMPPHLVEDAAGAGVDLLPGMGDLEPVCECGAWDQCGHTAALCYQVARLLDENPFVLLLMRGRAENAVLEDLQARSTRSSAPSADSGPSPAYDGVDAEEAYATGAILPPLPAPPELPEGPGVPPSLDTGTAPPPGLDPAALEFLAARAAEEAYRLLADALHTGHEHRPVEGGLTAEQDRVRLLAGDPQGAVAERLSAGRSGDESAVAVRAWRYGGPAALSVLEEEWTPDGEVLARARAALATAWEGDEQPGLRQRGNRWTVADGSRQLRLDRAGRWWPYRAENGRWVPAGEPVRDPATALASAQDTSGDGTAG
jgi:uncharacterized Zn finger protein